VLALKLAPVGNGRGETKRLTAPPPGLVAETVKTSVSPRLTTLLPMGLSLGPRETVKVEETDAEFPAKSEMATETVCKPWVIGLDGIKENPVAVRVD
jgi:hypothetical protein